MNMEECRTVNDDQTSVRSPLTAKFGRWDTVVVVRCVMIPLRLIHPFRRPLLSVFRRHRSVTKKKMRRWENWTFLMSKERLFAAVIGVTCSIVAYESLRVDVGRWCIQILLKTSVKPFVAPFGTFGNLLLSRQNTAKRLQCSILSCIVKDQNRQTSSNDHCRTNARPRLPITIHWHIPWPT